MSYSTSTTGGFVPGFGTVTNEIQEFFPSGIDPTWIKEWLLLRWAWADSDTFAIFNTNTNAFATRRLLWSDSDGTRIDIDSAVNGMDRITAIGRTGTPPAYTYDRSRNWLRDMGDIRNQSATAVDGESPCALFDASGATLLSTYFYPDPTHLALVAPDASLTNAWPMTDVAATHPRAYLQSIPQCISRGGSGIASTRQGIGFVDTDGSRLMYVGPASAGGMAGFNGTWIRPGAPITPLLPWMTGFLSASGFVHAAYGLPDVEVWTGLTYVNSGGVMAISSVDIQLNLHWLDKFGVQTNVNNIVSVNVPQTNSYSSGGSDYLDFTLDPTDSGHSTTIPSDAMAFKFTTTIVVTGSNYAFYDGNSGHWHKCPCYVQPFAISGGVNESCYLPGWLFDPT